MTFAVIGLSMFAGSAVAQEMPKPGAEHEKLKAFEGNWEAVIKFAGQEMKGECAWKMEMNGMHLTSNFTGDFGGMKFEGKGTTSYCPIRKKYISTWMDNMTPTPMVMDGKFEDDKTFTESGEGPNQQQKIVKQKSKTVWKDKDTMTMTMWEVGEDGKETETMTITYTRKK